MTISSARSSPTISTDQQCRRGSRRTQAGAQVYDAPGQAECNKSTIAFRAMALPVASNANADDAPANGRDFLDSRLAMNANAAGSLSTAALTRPGPSVFRNDSSVQPGPLAWYSLSPGRQTSHAGGLPSLSVHLRMG
jgi:hypothetical protein